MDQTYKARKEDFVSNLSGGTIGEINLVTLVASAAALLWSALQSRLSFFSPYGPAALLTDFLLNVIAILFATTAYSSAPLLLNVLLISPAVIVSFLPRQNREQHVRPSTANGGAKSSAGPKTENKANPFPMRPFLTTYRGAMMVVTCVAILAVDFPVFPRRFAKVENWGTSLMDIGVGSFVFSGGLVSARSVLKAQADIWPEFQPTFDASKYPPLSKRLLASFRHALPLLVLGLIRLWSVKGLDYAEHVTEYGVHWNFFFTLALLPPSVELFDSVAALLPSYELLAFLLAVSYQIALESTDLKAYILIAPRGASFLSKNREGIFSFVGYLAIFLAGRGTGMQIIPRSKYPWQRDSRQARRQPSIALLIRSIVSVQLFYLFTPQVVFKLTGLAAEPVSRRLANLPYVLWVVAFNTTQLLLFSLVDTVFFPDTHLPPPGKRQVDPAEEKARTDYATSRVMTAFNANGLPVFLVANLLTGAINLGVNTLDTSDKTALAILVGYAAVVTGLAMGLQHFGIRLKL